jgi:hypothetical protein
LGESKRRRLGWAIVIATVSGTAAWAADAPAERGPPRAAGPPAYKLECPRLVATARAPAPGKSLALDDALKAGAIDVDLRLRSRWLVDPRASLADDGFYSLEEQLAYFVAHEPGLVVRFPETLSRSPSRIELATLELHLPF